MPQIVSSLPPYQRWKQTTHGKQGHKIYKRWTALGEDMYTENNAGRPHFLYVTPNDPNESPVAEVRPAKPRAVVITS
jgi:hypothetical protein